MAEGLPHILTAPRAAALCRQQSLRRIVFAIILVLAGMLPAVNSLASNSLSSREYFEKNLDLDGNGIEDLLDHWYAGNKSWAELRLATTPRIESQTQEQESFPGDALPVQKVWKNNLIRLLCFGINPANTAKAVARASAKGDCFFLHEIERFGGVQVLAVDPSGLRDFLAKPLGGRILLDRDGTPALDTSIRQMGARQAATGYWKLGEDWLSTVAILDSGCDTAHDDLGDPNNDNHDGPPPGVGDVFDWSPGNLAWPTQSGYRVVGWKDVSDDFPEAQGPWDYHHHGTALASVVAGSGRVLEDHRGVAPAGRLTVVKFYDFDQVWHTWAGDFLAACDWTLTNRDAYRVRVVLSAVNWDVDLGISDAMDEMVAVGLLPVVAMGNFGTDSNGPGFPASLPGVLTVGSANDAGAVSAFSGRGLAGTEKPDLLAPGGGLLPSGGRIEVADNEPNDTYSERWGTSLAAAHVAGAVLLLDEALRANGFALLPESESIHLVHDLLCPTTNRIDQMENPSGTKLLPLIADGSPDETRGWGQLRVDAAVDAALRPLFPGTDQTDTLTSDDGRPVIARRLVLQQGVQYLLEANPQAGLDIELDFVAPQTLGLGFESSDVSREDGGGAGDSEFLLCEARQKEFVYLVVRRISGGGTVSLRLRESDSFVQQGRLSALPGPVSAPPNTGQMPNSFGTTVVIPSLVDLDSNARSVNVLDSWGIEVPGWPVFLFPDPSSIGGLTQPLVWDLDDNDGDEIVLGSDYGTLYFFNNLGAYHTVVLPINHSLTAPVGLESTSGSRQIAVVDDQGIFRTYSWGPVLNVSRELGFADPLQPAVGELVAGEPERVVVAFGNGALLVLDQDGLALPGWPQMLGTNLTLPPVLADIDADGDREILLPVFDKPSGSLFLRLFEANGTTANYDGLALPAPEGGSWLEVSWPVLAGWRAGGDLRIELAGLYSNNLSGAETRWGLGRAGWYTGGSLISGVMPSLKLGTTTNQGFLQLDRALLAPPLAWDFRDGYGSEVFLLAAVHWREILFGLTSFPGSSLGWFSTEPVGNILDDRHPLALGGIADPAGTSVAGVLAPISGDLYLQVQIRDSVVHFLPVRTAHQFAPNWPSARADQRNSGSYPVLEDLTPAAGYSLVVSELIVFPNPGRGRFQFAWKGETEGVDSAIEIYDLRGRLVSRLAPDPAKGGAFWDGKDTRGQQAAAGTYLAVAHRQGKKSVTRLVLTK